MNEGIGRENTLKEENRLTLYEQTVIQFVYFMYFNANTLIYIGTATAYGLDGPGIEFR